MEPQEEALSSEASTENVRIINRESNLELDADYYPADLAVGVIAVHGATRDRSHNLAFRDILGELQNQGIQGLAFDFNGHGKSDGESVDVTIETMVDDIRTAVAFLKGKGVEKIGIMAISLGAAATALYINREPSVKAVAFLSPVLDYNTAMFNPTTEASKQLFGAVHAALKNGAPHVPTPWNGFKVGQKVFDSMLRPENNPIPELKKFRGPVVVLHAKDDADISIDDVRKLMTDLGFGKEGTRRFQEVMSAQHDFTAEPGRTMAEKMLTDFFEHSLI